MSQVEETTEKASERTIEKGDSMTESRREKVVAGLLGNEKAVAPLLKFLETTDVGGREGAREWELEWERMNDRAGEDLLD